MAKEFKPYEQGCRVCGDQSQRLRRGLCTRHYQQFLKKQSQLDQQSPIVAETFENDCVWRGLLDPRRKAGRPKLEPDDVFEAVAEDILTTPSAPRPVQADVEQFVTQVLDTDQGSIDERLTQVAVQSRSVAAMNVQLLADPDDTVAMMADATVNYPVVYEQLFTTHRQSAKQVATRQAAIDRFLLAKSVAEEVVDFAIPSALYGSMVRRLRGEQDDLRFRDRVLTALDQIEADESLMEPEAVIQVWHQTLHLNQSPEETARQLELSVPDTKLYLSRCKAAFRTVFQTL